jgi:hypothetical protein
VEGANPNAIEDLGADEGQKAVRHVIRRTTGKCRDQNPLGWDALGEEACDTPNENCGLSRPSSRKDKRCPSIKPKCRFLTRIQAFGKPLNIDVANINGCFRRGIGDHASTQNTASCVPV